MPSHTLTITDNRTGKAYEIPIVDGTIKAMDLRQIKTGPDQRDIVALAQRSAPDLEQSAAR